MFAQPEHQFLARAEVTKRVADSRYRLAVQREECLRIEEPIADLHGKNFTPVCSRRQSLTGEPPSLRELFTGHDEAILDPLNTRCFATRCGAPQAARCLTMRVVSRRGTGVRHSRSSVSCPWQMQPLLADGSA